MAMGGHARSLPLAVLVWAGALALAGCAVGPDFLRPSPPAGKDYAPATIAEPTAAADVQGGAAQRFLRDKDIPGQWWQLFHSEPLNTLIAAAFQANPDVAAAQAALRVAEENAAAQRGAFYPQVAGNLTPSRTKTATGAVTPTAASGGAYLTLYTAQVSVSYVPDVFGLNQRAVESLEAQAESQRFQLEATYLTLTSNLAAAAIQEASLRGQIAATEDIIGIERQLLDLFRRQLALGHIAEADVVAQEAALAQAEASLPPLRKQLAIERDLLTALTGRFPNEEPAETFELASIQLPEDLPASLPAQVVEQRPDIRQAEANLHTASALVGVAVANRLPNLTLTGSAGTAATDPSRFFTPGTGFWSIAASLTQPIFDGGTLLHKERAARAALEQSAAQYRATVITAFQNVADTLRALQIDADALSAALRAERAAAQSLAIARRQLELGAISYLSLLNAQQTYQTARIALVQAQANRYADTAALFQALGGGWWNRNDVAAAATNVRTPTAGAGP
ncbi:MAG TPA: efflux transporter outer membrane subunit [Stellaceae bacterium]|nr:efflux transporter outer membrane subunit [Stellaceae bacterium]